MASLRFVVVCDAGMWLLQSVVNAFKKVSLTAEVMAAQQPLLCYSAKPRLMKEVLLLG